MERGKNRNIRDQLANLVAKGAKSGALAHNLEANDSLSGGRVIKVGNRSSPPSVLHSCAASRRYGKRERLRDGKQ